MLGIVSHIAVINWPNLSVDHNLTVTLQFTRLHPSQISVKYAQVQFIIEISSLNLYNCISKNKLLHSNIPLVSRYCHLNLQFLIDKYNISVNGAAITKYHRLWGSTPETHFLTVLEAASMVRFWWALSSHLRDGHPLAVYSHGLSLVHECGDRMRSLFLFLSGHPSYWIRIPPLCTYLNFNYFLKALSSNIVRSWVRL